MFFKRDGRAASHAAGDAQLVRERGYYGKAHTAALALRVRGVKRLHRLFYVFYTAAAVTHGKAYATVGIIGAAEHYFGFAVFFTVAVRMYYTVGDRLGYRGLDISQLVHRRVELRGERRADKAGKRLVRALCFEFTGKAVECGFFFYLFCYSLLVKC